MKFKQTDFLPVIFGNDINVYSLARSFYEAYGIQSKAFGKATRSTCYKSKLVDFTEVAKVDTPDVLLKTVQDFVNRGSNQGKKLLLLGCGDNYVKAITKHANQFPKNVVVPYDDHEKLLAYMDKKQFYALCEEKGIPYPKTLEITEDKCEFFKPDFQGPYVLKPSNQILYNTLNFEGQKKVFVAHTPEELRATAQKVFRAGYDDVLIIQEFIPGDDSNMRVLTSYSDQHGKVKLQCLGHVLLEEHTPQGIGNHAVILNEHNPDLMAKFRNLLEELQFTGFSNMDIKYDQRDNQYKVFEINVRQGRSNYYVTGSGHSLVKALVEDRIYNHPLSEDFSYNEHLWLVIPPKVACEFAPVYADEINRLIKEGKWVNPLFFKGDNHPVRLLRLWRSQKQHLENYRTHSTIDHSTNPPAVSNAHFFHNAHNKPQGGCNCSDPNHRHE